MAVYYIDLHYKLSVACRALPRELLVVPGVREDDLASPLLGFGIGTMCEVLCFC